MSEKAKRLRGELDAVIFDMDGVLIDISRSIRQVNYLAVPFYLREVLGWSSTDQVVTSETVELYKQAGGFNNDWDLSCAIILLLLLKSQLWNTTNADELLDRDPTFEWMTAEIYKRGGWLVSASQIIFEWSANTSIDFDQIRRDYRPKLVEQIFKEMLFGDLCQRVYGTPATLYHGKGLIYEDRCLLDHSLLPTDKKMGLQTGREFEEAQIGLETCGLLGKLPPEYCITASDGFSKPKPGGLMALCNRLHVKRAGVYIGDTLDDFRTVENLNSLAIHAPFISALTLSGPAGNLNEKLFLESGADIVANDVNEVLKWISHG